MDETRGPKKARLDDIDAVLEMTGMDERTRRWVVTGEGQPDEFRVEAPGKLSKDADDWMRRRKKAGDTWLLDRLGQVPGMVMEIRMNLKELKDERKSIINVIDYMKPLLILMDAGSDEDHIQDEYAKIAWELVERQVREERYAVVVHGRDDHLPGRGWFECGRGVKRRVSSNSRMITKMLDDEEYNSDEGEFDEAVVHGLCQQLVRDGRVRSGCLGSVIGSHEDKMKYWDDLSGEELDAEGVDAARKEEMEEYKKHGVYTKVPIKECWDETGKEPIGTRWVDINKGDRVNPEYRSRLVAQDIKTNKRDALFAATPPLEAKTMLISLVASDRGMRGKERMKLDFIDVRRAYCHAKARRLVYVKLTKEDYEDGMCGKLVKAMYGTRDAAQKWER